MTTKVLKELAVAVSSYEDRATGQMKSRYQNIGVLMESTNDRGESNQFLMLDRAFNPAGVPFKPGADKILISMFDPKPRDAQQRQSSQSQTDNRSQNGAPATVSARSDLDDEIPF
jgi:hypothetical protein